MLLVHVIKKCCYQTCIAPKKRGTNQVLNNLKNTDDVIVININHYTPCQQGLWSPHLDNRRLRTFNLIVTNLEANDDVIVVQSSGIDQTF